MDDHYRIAGSNGSAAIILAPAAGQPDHIAFAGNASVASPEVFGRSLIYGQALTIQAIHQSQFSELILDGGTLDMPNGGLINNSTIYGPGTLTNIAGASLKLNHVTVYAPLVNYGILDDTQNDYFAGGLTAAAGSTLRSPRLLWQRRPYLQRDRGR